MSITKPGKNDRTFEIVSPMDERGRLVIRDPVTDVHYTVVDYADDLVRQRLAGRAPGAVVRLELVAAPDRPDSYMAARVLPGATL